jgi:type 1 glutamine amidotransferase
MSKAENRKVLEGDKWKGKIDDPSKVDVPVSWLKEVGKGRLFYTNLGHNDLTFASKTVLLHMLDGIQYALGDLQADAVPSSKAKVEVVLAPDKPE